MKRANRRAAERLGLQAQPSLIATNDPLAEALSGSLRDDSSLVPHTLRQFDSRDSLDQLTALLHRAYAAHAAAGRHFFASYQSPADTQRRIAKGECWLAVDGSTLLGTVTVVAPYSFPDGYPAPRDAGTFYQLAVDPEHQAQGLGDALLRQAEARIRSLGSRTIAIDTSRLATDLIRWYEKRGYKETGSWRWDVTNYESVVLVKDLP